MTRRAMRGTLEEMNDPALFPSILCGTDYGAAGIAARRQAEWLAGAEGDVELVPTHTLTRHGPEALCTYCEGHDLLVLGSEAEAHAVLPDVRIPVLLARWCPDGFDVTDRILVAVGDHPGSVRAARLAAAIAARHRGEVALVAAPAPSHEIEHALAASGRIVLCTAGIVPAGDRSARAPRDLGAPRRGRVRGDPPGRRGRRRDVAPRPRPRHRAARRLLRARGPRAGAVRAAVLAHRISGHY